MSIKNSALFYLKKLGRYKKCKSTYGIKWKNLEFFFNFITKKYALRRIMWLNSLYHK